MVDATFRDYAKTGEDEEVIAHLVPRSGLHGVT